LRGGTSSSLKSTAQGAGEQAGSRAEAGPQAALTLRAVGGLLGRRPRRACKAAARQAVAGADGAAVAAAKLGRRQLEAEGGLGGARPGRGGALGPWLAGAGGRRAAAVPVLVVVGAQVTERGGRGGCLGQDWLGALGALLEAGPAAGCGVVSKQPLAAVASTTALLPCKRQPGRQQARMVAATPGRRQASALPTDGCSPWATPEPGHNPRRATHP
jgi:hypothetical protein